MLFLFNMVALCCVVVETMCAHLCAADELPYALLNLVQMSAPGYVSAIEAFEEVVVHLLANVRKTLHWQPARVLYRLVESRFLSTQSLTGKPVIRRRGRPEDCERS